MVEITRIAPSPTGDMHLGTVRTAYFNWLAAKATGGKFILRIDDTDVDRNDEAHVDTIYRVFEWLGLDYDLTFRQSSRIDRYNEVAESLVSENWATRADNGAILLNPQFDTSGCRANFTDTLRGSIPITKKNHQIIDGLVLMAGKEKNYQPLYHFASVVDDIDYGVTWVIRGDDHLANTSKHVVLYDLLGASLPKFTHLGLITAKVDGKPKKMSKRDGDASMISYMNAGYDPDGMLNFLLRLGWGPKVDDKASTFMDKTRAISLFVNDGNLKSSPANFDPIKLKFYNQHYKNQKERIKKQNEEIMGQRT